METVAAICRRLDGLPLAIELAAARLNTLTPDAIVQRLNQRFALLTGGPVDRPLRHQTLEAAIGWSCALLDEKERTLFRRLGVFRGGFGLDLVESLFESDRVPAVDLIDHLATLVDYSLVSQLETAGEPRFEMLDTVHAYARKLLAERAEEDAWRRRHAERVAAWVEEGEWFYCRPDQDRWLRALEREHDNVRAAIRWALGNDKASLAIRLGAAVWPFWWLRGYLSEARSWLEEILATPGRAPRIARAKALVGASWMATAAAEHEKAAELAKRSMALYRAAGDTPGRMRALETLGFVCLEAGDTEAARSAFCECLEKSKATGDERRKAIALEALGQIALTDGDDLRATSLLQNSVTIARRIGQAGQVGQGLLFLGNIAHRSGDLEHALSLYDEALTIYRGAGQKMNIASVLSCMGRVYVDREEIDPARAAYAEALTLFQELRYVRGTAVTVMGFAALALAKDHAGRAARLLGGAEALLESVADRLSVEESNSFESLKVSARDQLGTPRFAARSTEGCALSEASLVSLAIAEGPSPRRKSSAIRKGRNHHSSLPA
jgi:non-specific serine/threonine protein kinase